MSVRSALFPEPWMRWYDLPGLRRLCLARWSFMGGKHWHPRARRLARLRALYWVLVRGHESEICARCGSPVRLVFHVPDELWARVAGFPWSNDRDPGGEAAAGVLCPPCVDDLYCEASVGPDGERDGSFLRWTCAPDDSAQRG